MTITERTRLAIILQTINCTKLGYLKRHRKEWEKEHICHQLAKFTENRAMDETDINYEYVNPTVNELSEAFLLEANIPIHSPSIKLEEIVRNYPLMFCEETEEK